VLLSRTLVASVNSISRIFLRGAHRRHHFCHERPGSARKCPEVPGRAPDAPRADPFAPLPCPSRAPFRPLSIGSSPFGCKGRSVGRLGFIHGNRVVAGAPEIHVGAHDAARCWHAFHDLGRGRSLGGRRLQPRVMNLAGADLQLPTLKGRATRGARRAFHSAPRLAA